MTSCLSLSVRKPGDSFLGHHGWWLWPPHGAEEAEEGTDAPRDSDVSEQIQIWGGRRTAYGHYFLYFKWEDALPQDIWNKSPNHHPFMAFWFATHKANRVHFQQQCTTFGEQESNNKDARLFTEKPLIWPPSLKEQLLTPMCGGKVWSVTNHLRGT